jgi:hypothetical protein
MIVARERIRAIVVSRVLPSSTPTGPGAFQGAGAFLVGLCNEFPPIVTSR